MRSPRVQKQRVEAPARVPLIFIAATARRQSGAQWRQNAHLTGRGISSRRT